MSRRHPKVPGMLRRPRRTLFVLPSIADELDERLKSALALRNACTVQGRCPDCGATGTVTEDATTAGVFHVTFVHKDVCGVLLDSESAA